MKKITITIRDFMSIRNPPFRKKLLTDTPIIRSFIHKNKTFLRSGGILIIKSKKKLLFDSWFFVGYKIQENKNIITIKK